MIFILTNALRPELSPSGLLVNGVVVALVVAVVVVVVVFVIVVVVIKGLRRRWWVIRPWHCFCEEGTC